SLGEEPLPDRAEPPLCLALALPGGMRQIRQRDAPLEHAAAVLERALRGDPECRGCPPAILGPEHRLQLRRAPDEVLPLLALAVGVLGGVERAGTVGHLPAEPLHQAGRALPPRAPRSGPP